MISLREQLKGLDGVEGVASKMLKKLPPIGEKVDKSALCNTVPFAQRSSAEKVVRWMVAEGLLQSVPSEEILTCDADPKETTFLAGYAQGLSENNDDSGNQIVLTLPKRSTHLKQALPAIDAKTVHILGTEETVDHLAFSARKRLVVLTPFLDSTGAQQVLRMFQNSGCPEKHLILRFTDDPKSDFYPKGFSEIRDVLESTGVTVSDYSLSTGSTGWKETFHAKVVLADRERAYIGSANMTARSLESSMELGVLLQGEDVVNVANIIDAILNISNRIPTDQLQ